MAINKKECVLCSQTTGRYFLFTAKIFWSFKEGCKILVLLELSSSSKACMLIKGVEQKNAMNSLAKKGPMAKGPMARGQSS